MEVSELLEIISQGETSKVEFKGDIDSPDKLNAEMVAFANSLGGLLIIGVDDNADVKGLSKDQLKKYQNLAMNLAANNTKPPIGSIWTEVVKIEDKNVLLIYIEKGITLYRDKNHSVWVRSGPNKRKVIDNAEMSRLMQEKKLLYAEQQIIGNATLADVNIGLFKEFYKNRFEEVIIDKKGEVERILNNLKLLVNDNLTLASLLLFGNNNRAIIPQFCINAIWFDTNEFLTDKYRSSDNIYGTMVEKYNKGKDFVVSKLNRIQKDKDFNSIGDLEIPELVIKELLINAIFHRDYFIEDSIKLYIFPNRVEIKNPGRLPNNLTVEDIKRGIQRRDRNILLTSYAIDLLPYRGIGSGILNSLKAYPHIDFESNLEADYFKVTIHRPAQ
ncbi:putative DNA binding domain-containing protein [candidate division KSB1 bacterium]|nr:putative DNA binding domain-containing protein [candidate division KSB1 bacterium]